MHALQRNFYFSLQEEDDNDYESESSGHDSIDTDFADTEEEDNEGSDAGGGGSDDEKKKRRTRRVVTKSYKVSPVILLLRVKLQGKRIQRAVK